MFRANIVIQSFWDEVGCKQLSRYIGVIYDLLFVHSMGCDVLSVVTKSWQREVNSPGFRTLSKVPLADHSIHVANALPEVAGNDLFYGLGLIAALGHDLGKNRVYRNLARGRYESHQHAWDSADATKEIIAGRLTPKETETVYWSIYDHHGPSNERLTKMLKRADEKARIDEGVTADYHYKLYGCDDELAPQSWGNSLQTLSAWPIRAEWFNGRSFCFNYLYKCVNNPMNDNSFEAISMPNGYCYFFVETVFQAFCKMAEDMGDTELAQRAKGNQDKRRDVLVHIARELRACKYFGEHLLPPDWYCFGYTVNIQQGSPRQYTFMPIRTRAFTLDTGRLESKKNGSILTRITSIHPRKNGDIQ